MKALEQAVGETHGSLGIFQMLGIALHSWVKALRHFSIVDSCRLVAYACLTKPSRSGQLAKLAHRRFGPLYIRPGTSDPFVLEQVLIDSQYDLADAPQFARIVEAYRTALRKGETPLIVDCGANIGLSALYFSALFPQARVVAIEPSAANAAVARRNVAGRDKIRIMEAAIDSRARELILADPGLGSWGLVTRADGPGAAVRSTTMNDILRESGAERCLIAKIDIEGAERELFAANLEWLDRVDLLIIELHDWLYPGEGGSVALFSALAGRRFDFLMRQENLCFFFA